MASPGGIVYTLALDTASGILSKTHEARNTGGTAGFVSVSVSPDGKYVYGVGGQPSGLVVFGRDAVSGELTVLHDYKDNQNGHYLGQAFNPTLSPIKNIATSSTGTTRMSLQRRIMLLLTSGEQWRSCHLHQQQYGSGCGGRKPITYSGTGTAEITASVAENLNYGPMLHQVRTLTVQKQRLRRL